MARTSKARIFRSTQTAPNTGTTRDLTTVFGTAANAATSVTYTAAGTVTWRRWSPHSSFGGPQDPAVVTIASGEGWRDTVGENAAEQVRYAAGTWTTRVRLTKTGQTIAADITVRVTVVVYRVTSAGDHVAEIGRATTADTTLSTATLTLSPSFTTGAAVTFNAGDKIQVECYVTPITAGLPTAPAAAVSINFLVDETSANSGASLTAIPTHDILYARALSASGASTAVLARQIVMSKSLSVAGASTAVLVRRLGLLRPFSVAGSGTTPMTKRLQADRPLSVAGSGSGVLAKRLVLSRVMSASGLSTVGMTKSLVLQRILTVTGASVATLSKAMNFSRFLSVEGLSAVNLSKTINALRDFSVTGTGTGVFTRALTLAKSLVVTGTGTGEATRTLTINRFFSVTATSITVMGKSLTFDRRFAAFGSALTRMRIEMPEAVLDRMVAGGGQIVTVIKKFFTIADD